MKGIAKVKSINANALIRSSINDNIFFNERACKKTASGINIPAMKRRGGDRNSIPMADFNPSNSGKNPETINTRTVFARMNKPAIFQKKIRTP